MQRLVGQTQGILRYGSSIDARRNAIRQAVRVAGRQVISVQWGDRLSQSLKIRIEGGSRTAQGFDGMAQDELLPWRLEKGFHRLLGHVLGHTARQVVAPAREEEARPLPVCCGLLEPTAPCRAGVTPHRAPALPPGRGG